MKVVNETMKIAVAMKAVAEAVVVVGVATTAIDH